MLLEKKLHFTTNFYSNFELEFEIWLCFLISFSSLSGLDQQNTTPGQHQTGGNSMTPGNPSDSEGAGSNPASVGRRRHTSSGQSQVRSLYDGLSHLYTDCDSRYVKWLFYSKFNLKKK